MIRIIDLVLSVILLLILWPVILIIALLIWIVEGLPILFKQQRPGLQGKPFIFYKFRTMREGTGSDTDRLTSLGRVLRKYSLDELPQLWNVVRGDLSMVGPRPLLMEYLPLYNKEQARRHEVKPGITGWAQVNGRNAITWEEKFALDVWYVDHRSLRLDLKILWLTLMQLFRTKDVDHSEKLTMPKFTGNIDE